MNPTKETLPKILKNRLVKIHNNGVISSNNAMYELLLLGFIEKVPPEDKKQYRISDLGLKYLMKD